MTFLNRAGEQLTGFRLGEVVGRPPSWLPPLLEGARAHVPMKHFADALKAVLQAYPTRTADFELLVPAIGLGTYLTWDLLPGAPRRS